MTSPAPSGGPSPLRLGALALIGVAVVSAIIGLSTLATNPGDSPPSAAPAPTPIPTATPLPTEAPPAGPLPTIDGAAPAPDVSAGGSTAPPAPGAPAPAIQAPAPAAPGGSGAEKDAVPGEGKVSAGGGGGGTSAVRVPVRVYNNSTIQGLATRAAQDFRQAGWPVEEVGNYPHGIIPTSTVYYRPGTDEEAAARALGEQFGLRVQPRFEGLQDASPGLIVIVTNDYGGPRRTGS
jgi:hypothetical protein